jgi:hypothetical protein
MAAGNKRFWASAAGQTNFTIYRKCSFYCIVIYFWLTLSQQSSQDNHNQKEIALYSFNQFGHNCWYATCDTIIDAIVIPTQTE